MGRSRSPLDAARAYLAGRSIRDLGLGVFLAALLVSGLFGGWQEAADETPALTVGEPITATPVTVTVLGATTATDMGNHLLSETEGRYLVVAADLVTEQTQSIPHSDVADAIRVRGVEGLFRRYDRDRPAHEIPPKVIVAADRSELGDLPPGLTYRTLLVWEQRPGSPAPTEVTVEVYGKTYRESSIDATMRWFDPALAARATIPVQPRLEAVAP